MPRRKIELSEKVRLARSTDQDCPVTAAEKRIDIHQFTGAKFFIDIGLIERHSVFGNSQRGLRAVNVPESHHEIVADYLKFFKGIIRIQPQRFQIELLRRSGLKARILIYIGVIDIPERIREIETYAVLNFAALFYKIYIPYSRAGRHYPVQIDRVKKCTLIIKDAHQVFISKQIFLVFLALVLQIVRDGILVMTHINFRGFDHLVRVRIKARIQHHFLRVIPGIVLRYLLSLCFIRLARRQRQTDRHKNCRRHDTCHASF